MTTGTTNQLPDANADTGADTGAAADGAQRAGRFPVFDGHNDLAWAMRKVFEYDLDKADLAAGCPALATDLPRLRAGRVGYQFWSVYVPCSFQGGEAVRATLEQIDFVHRLCARYPESLAFVRTADEARAAYAQGRVASLLGAEGGHSIAGSLGVLRAFAMLGVRYMTLTHTKSTEWADSATDAPVSHGLSDFGRAVVREMNRLGMLVDLSHVSVETMDAALDTTERPAVFSHSSCKDLTDHPRNVPDRVLERLKTNGGLCMVTLVPQFVSQRVADWHLERDGVREAAQQEQDEREADARVAAFTAANPRPAATVADVADHFDRAREVAGIDHVGVGGDYDGCDPMPQGLEDVAAYPRLFEELARRGWSARDLAKASHENMLRVLADNDADADADTVETVDAGARAAGIM